MEKFYEKLPTGYVCKKIIDGTNKKIGIIFNILCLVIGSIVCIISYFIKQVDIFTTVERNDLMVALFIFLISLILTIIIHELLHGLAYKILTKQKLTFGLTLSVAFCGVPNIYVSKKTALISVLLPFAFFTVFYIILIAILPNNIYAMFAILAFGVHTGGCVGDLYAAYILLFKMSNKCLMNDTGPIQSFFDI